jgi:hypothetical protein
MCDRCSTWYDLASILRGRRGTLDRWNGKMLRGRQLCTQLSILAELLRFLTLPMSKVEKTSQNFFDLEL